MVASINASTSAGVVTTADTSGVLALQTAGTTAVTIDASQNVGIGTASPAAKLELGSGTLLLPNNVFIQQKDSSGNAKNVAGVNSSNQYNFGGLDGSSTVNTIRALVAGNEAMRIDSSSRVLVGLTSANTSGANFQVSSGITFPATQSASSDVNTLDDYEEGSWTPALGGSATYSTQRGGYVKVGRLVFIQCQLVVSAIGTGSTTTISGLPFSVSNPSGGADAYPQGAVGYLNGSNINFYSVVCNPQANTSTVQFTAQSILGTGYQNVTAALFTTGTHIQFSSFYYTST